MGTIFEELRELANLGYEEFKNNIDSRDDVFYDEEIVNDEIEVNVYSFDYDEGSTILGTYVFNKDDNFVREI